jgi:polyhydroxyalkanoate synthesis regulator phasin
MSTEPNGNPENTPVEVISNDPSLVTQTTPPETNEIKDETLALIDAIRKKAQSEAQKAGEFARDNYLEAVRRAREEIEKKDLFEPENIKEAMQQIQTEVEKDWDNLVKEVTSLGERLNDAAKAAWETLSAPRK